MKDLGIAFGIGAWIPIPFFLIFGTHIENTTWAWVSFCSLVGIYAYFKGE